MTNDPWTRIYVAGDALEAQVVASALKHAGIEAQLRPADRSGFGAALPTLDRAGVWVQASDAVTARAIIERAQQSESGQLSLADSPGGALGLAEDDE